MKKQTPFSKTHFQFVYAARRVIDFVFPLYCLSCGKKISTPFSFAFCRTCFRRLVFIRDFSCSLCGRPLPGDPQSSSLCRQCRENRYAFDRCFSSLVFTETL
ncbi:MAG: hypothetical protein JW928_01845, partial [Candidatus Aureabacteria bacterium]|nr:hypothetical protein [Candidatus Auribacterota bacterium]